MIITGLFQRRFKRFFMEVMLDDGQEVVAHIANTGSMLGLLTPNTKVLLTFIDDEKRKLKYSVEAVLCDNEWVGVNTHMPNKIIKEALLNKDNLLQDFHGYKAIKSEVKYGVNLASRVDFLLSDHTDNQPNMYLEIKNVTLKENNLALFPDSVSERAYKHVKDLILSIKNGHKAALLFLAQRSDIKAFSIAKHIDPAYYEIIKEAKNKGLIIKALSAKFAENKIVLSHELAVKI
jgi:sugar fermentation stimulation protein A